MVAASTVTIHAQVDAQRAMEVASSHALSAPSAHGDLTHCLTNCLALEDLRLRWCAAHIAPTEAAT